MLPIRAIMAPVKICGATLKFVSHRIQREEQQMVESPPIIEHSNSAQAMSPEVILHVDNGVQESNEEMQDEHLNSFEKIGGIEISPVAKSFHSPANQGSTFGLNICERTTSNCSIRVISQISISLMSCCVPTQDGTFFSSVKVRETFLISRLKLKTNADLSLPKEREENVNDFVTTANNENLEAGGRQQSEEVYEEMKKEGVQNEKKRVRRRRRGKKSSSRQQTAKPEVASSSHSLASAAVSTESPCDDPMRPISVSWTAADGTKRVAHTFDDVCAIFNPNHIPRNADGSVKTPPNPKMLKKVSVGSSLDTDQHFSIGRSQEEREVDQQVCFGENSPIDPSQVPQAARAQEVKREENDIE